MKEYVCMFARRGPEVLLVVKNQPAWQAGRLNGIGGKIEPGETIFEAMVREWSEEVGGELPRPDLFATVQEERSEWRVWFFRTELAADFIAPPANDVGEVLQWQPLDLRLMPMWAETRYAIPNLSWLIPMAHSDGAHVLADATARNLP